MYNNLYIIKIIFFSIVLFIIMLIIPITYIQMCNIEKELNMFLKNIKEEDIIDIKNYCLLLKNFLDKEISIDLIDSSICVDKSKNNNIPSEIIKAQRHGFGKSLRYNKKDKKFYMYMANKHNNYIIDIYKEFKFIEYNIKEIIVMLAIIIIYILYFIIYVMKTISKRTIYNFCHFANNIWEDTECLLKDDIKSIFIRNKIQEFVPNIRKFEVLLKEQKEYTEKLKNKYESIKKILFSMNEGLIILDKEYNVLLSNKEVLKVFDLKDINNKNFIHIYRSEKFLNILKELKNNNKSTIFDIEKRNKEVYRVRISSVNNGGYIIFTTNITHILKLERIRSEFNCNVSHELKTPITTILGFAELISNKMVKEKEKIEEYSKKIFLESKRLIDLIDNMLRLSEIENCNFVEGEELNILDILKDILEILNQDIKKKKISVDIEGNSYIKMEHNHLLELLSNLISNAVKYNKENGKIYIKINTTEKKVKISIKDTGIGIKKEDVDRIFERFYRVDKGRNKKIQGTGLGLSIVKHIVELYKGKIKLKTNESGTEFIVYLNKL